MDTYVDFDYYKETYGGTIPEKTFNKLVIEASAIVKENTFDRININNIPKEVKHCTCEIIDKLNEYAVNAKKQGNKTAETVDKWHVNYGAIKTDNEFKFELQSILKTYLWNIADSKGTPLLYRGVLICLNRL